MFRVPFQPCSPNFSLILMKYLTLLKSVGTYLRETEN